VRGAAFVKWLLPFSKNSLQMLYWVGKNHDKKTGSNTLFLVSSACGQ